jgi:predicted RNase H-related nuclease YkuK (DUF458 family)
VSVDTQKVFFLAKNFSKKNQNMKKVFFAKTDNEKCRVTKKLIWALKLLDWSFFCSQNYVFTFELTDEKVGELSEAVSNKTKKNFDWTSCCC